MKTEHERGATPPWLLTLAVIVGYAAFRSANSSIYLSRFAQSPESFIFMTDPAFNITSALATVLCAVAVVALCAAGRLKEFSMPVVPAVAILLCGMGTTALEGSAPLPPNVVLALSVIAFAVGSIMLKMAWIELLAHEAPRQAIIQIACSAIASAAIQYGLSILGASWTIALTAVLLVASASLLLGVRGDMKRNEQRALERWRVHGSNGPWKNAVGEISDALLALCVLEAVIGLINSFMLAASMTFAGAAGIPSAAMAIAAALFCFAALITRHLPAASAMFRVAFPVVAAMVVFVPFASEGYTRFFSTVLLVGYDFVALLLLYQVAYASHKFKVSSYVLMALFSGCTKLCLLAALVIGGLFGGQERASESSTVSFLVLACAVIYILAIAAVLLSRDRRKRTALREAHRDDRAESADTAENAPAEAGAQDENAERESSPAATRNGGDALPQEQQASPSSIATATNEEEPLETTCRMLAEKHGLTGRETEILGYLAQGRTNTRIAEDLFISPSTVRGHIRHIYTKLDVHDRQELIDLFH